MSLENNLVIFTENYAKGGGNKYVIDIINSVADKYSDIYLISNKNAFYEEDKQKLKFKINIVPVFFVTSSLVVNRIKSFPSPFLFFVKLLFLIIDPLLFFINILLFISILLKIKPEKIVSCNGGFPASRASLAIVLAAKILRIKVFLTVVSMPTKRRNFIFIYESFIDKLIWNSVTLVIVNAKAILEALAEYRGMPKEKAVIIYNCLEDSGIIKRNFHIRAKSIVCISRIDKEKGITYLLDAFYMLQNKYPFLKLDIVGEGNLMEEVRIQIKKLKLKNKVTLLGHFSGNINAIIRNYDIFVLPSLWEGFSYTILEAMRSRSVIVSTKVGGIPEAITHRKSGLLVKSADSEALYHALDSLINNKNLRFQLANNARSAFVESFTSKNMAIELRKFI